ncbi:DEAD box ATP-dependent RNA helicase-like protein 3 [Sarcoptes scabiei]|uniref:ATP-dependent RNA helicase n=1 Tax=Sarcoptes scabiei TaxID=52283 RepID=A0A132AJF9_SARSC|nr:DEAD box ATP-dependent RNA helicase-like protein 3 [Sarcoptes scabiei]
MFQNSFCRSASYDRFKHLQQSIIQSIRFLSTEQIPIIKIPKYLQTNLSNAIYHEHRKVARSKKISTTNLRTELDRKHLYKKIISWSGDRKLFHYYGRRYDPNNVPLINTMHAVIPKILQFKNVIFSAETGSGKTIAYLAPLIQIIHQSKQLDRNQNRNPKLPYALIILPFRELTEQIGKIAKILARKKDVGVATMIGGLPKHIPQTGMDLIITTIGMIDSHLNNGIYSLRKLDHLVLDEIKI